MAIFVVCEECHDKSGCKDWKIHKIKTLAECSKCKKLTSCTECKKTFNYYHYQESLIINENSDA